MHMPKGVRNVPALEPLTIVAQDGADDDGGTLYTLFDDDGEPILSAAWPQPLETHARLLGRETRRGLSWTGASEDGPRITRRPRMSEGLIDEGVELSPEDLDAIDNDVDEVLEEERMDQFEAGGAADRAERFAATGDTEILLEGLSPQELVLRRVREFEAEHGRWPVYPDAHRFPEAGLPTDPKQHFGSWTQMIEAARGVTA
jgi:hypothetical protein